MLSLSAIVRIVALVLTCSACVSLRKRNLVQHPLRKHAGPRWGFFKENEGSSVGRTLRPLKLLSSLLPAIKRPCAAFHFSHAQFASHSCPENMGKFARRSVGNHICMAKAKNADDMIYETTMEWFNEDDPAGIVEKARYARVIYDRGGENERVEQFCREILDFQDYELRGIEDENPSFDVLEVQRLLAQSMMPVGDIDERQADYRVIDGTLDEAEELMTEVLTARKEIAKIDDVSVAIDTVVQSEEALELKEAEEDIGILDADVVDDFISEFYEEGEEDDREELFKDYNYGYRSGRGYRVRRDTSTFEGYIGELRRNIKIVLQILFDLAEMSVARDEMEKGKFLHLQVFTDRCKVLGKKDPATLKSAETLSQILEKMGLPDQAERLASRFAELSQEVAQEEWEEEFFGGSEQEFDVNKPSHLQLPVDEDGEPTGLRFLFVDEFSCIGCTWCASIAQNTFMMEESAGRARCYAQGQDDPEDVEDAIATCPVNCISYVDLEDLIILETEREESGGVDPDQISMRGVGQWTSKMSTSQSSRSKLFNTAETFCGNCPSNGCKRCPMFGVGLNPQYIAKQKTNEAKRKAKEEKKMAEALQAAAGSMPIIFDSEAVTSMEQLMAEEVEDAEEELELLPEVSRTNPTLVPTFDAKEELASDEDIDAEFAAWQKQVNSEDAGGIRWT